MEKIIALNSSNLKEEHICCAFSDKKCSLGYERKKEWLRKEFENGYVFRRLDARAKVFIEYGPAEKGWVPVDAPGYLLINCFWVSGQYKGRGLGKELLKLAWGDAEKSGKSGLVTVVGTRKFHFMSDTKWLIKQGFEACDATSSGFSLLVMKKDKDSADPQFLDSVRSGECENKTGLVAYYSNRCPYTEYYVTHELVETAAKRAIPLEIIRLENMEQARQAPTPATIFSLFRDGRFVTTDISVCLNNRFENKQV